MTKILFLINTLGGGGAERVLVNLVNNMDHSKFDITVETMFGDGVNKAALKSNIRYIGKNRFNIRGLSNIVKYIPSRLLYNYYIGSEHYDVVVAYMHGAPTKVVSGCRDKRIKTVTWLHYGNPSKGSFFRYWTSEKRGIQAYANLDAIVGVSHSVTNAFAEYTGISEKNHTLYNTNDTARILKLASESVSQGECSECVKICTAGRLTKQKGFDRLIDVAARLWDEGYRFQINILGAGPEEKNLKDLIASKNAEEYIHMLGFCTNPYSIMAKSDIYVLSSREEGLATVLTEALTLELPVVSTDVSGAKEVLGEKNEYGLVVENSENGIYEGIKELLTNEEKRKKYKEVAGKRAAHFDTNNTVRDTETFFQSLLDRA